MLDIGQTAPDFTLPDDRGGSFKLSAHRGKPVVVEFYCEDGTEGCEIENREFSALSPEFKKLGVEVVAISPQGVESHKKFAAKNNFAHPLLADTDLKAKFAQLEATPQVFTPAEYGAFLLSEAERWGKAVKAAGIKGD